MLKELFADAFNVWKGRTADERPKEGSPVYDYFKKKLEPTINQVIKDLGFMDLTVKASVGMGNWAEIPWIGIRHDNAAKSFEQGEYVVYLFSPDFGNLYLSMIEGVSKLGMDELKQKVASLRKKIKQPKGFSEDIADPLTRDQVAGSNPDKYQKGSIYTKKYESSQIPADAVLEEDLKTALESYQEHIGALKLSDLVFWKFSPGPKAIYWEGFKRRGIVAMGSPGENLGNLGKYSTVEDLQKVPKFPTSLNPRADYAHQLLRFRDEVKPGNVLVAYGNRSIYGFGVVPEDSIYQFDDGEDVNWWGIETPGMQHWRKVDWIKVLENPIDISSDGELYKDLSQNDTIHRIDTALTKKLQELMGDVKKDLIIVLPEYTKELEDFDPKFVSEFEELLKAKKQVILFGPPGTSKTHFALYFSSYLTQDFSGDPSRYKIVQFHPSYSYEDFVEGIVLRTTNVGLAYEPSPRILREICKTAKDDPEKKPHVLIIDEINRGSLAKIFGELIFSLEYRDHGVTLPYSNEKFSIPNNLYIIGTMNSADRSIALLDYALRRRFFFFSMEPDHNLLEKWLDKNGVAIKDKVIQIFTAFNERIRKNEKLGKHFQLGHTYFFVKSDEELERNWKYAIRPLLEEYFFGEQEALSAFEADINNAVSK